MSTRINVTVDNNNLKDKAQRVYRNLGMSLSTAINVFLKQSVRDNMLPFQPSNEPRESIKAQREAEHPEKLKKYSSIDDWWKNLND